ncbi:MAG TPA: tetratricopeptide repeat protein [Thermomicrobiales bacterium]|nr:tetratricopeptide repeat protein [Thermomicrobiales bacterium]
MVAPLIAERRFRVDPIPRPSTQLIGRSKEVSELKEIILDPGHGLVTFTGPGRAGKSHLSSQIARDILGHFSDGVVCVFYGTFVQRDTPILPVVADALGIREETGRRRVDTIAEAIGDARLLLLLDCLEHVVGDAQSVIDLLELCPGLKVLATSRIPLHVRGEYIYRVEPLTVPTPTSDLNADDVERFSAIDLFVRRMRMASSAPLLSSVNLAMIADICRRLDGIPLSIVLAAARTRVLTLSELHEQLDDQLSLLTSGPIDLPVRQQTLRSNVHGSYVLLSVDEKALFRSLAIFSGGWTVNAVAAVASDTPEAGSRVSVVDQLMSLIDQNLVVRRGDTQAESRYDILDTIRAFGLEMLDTHNERHAVSQRHFDYFLSLAEKLVSDITGQSRAFQPERVDADKENIRAGLSWAIDSNDATRALNLVVAMRDFWGVKGTIGEGRRWLDAALALRAGAPPALVARALNAACWLACHQGDLDRAAGYAEQSLRLNRNSEDANGLADALHGAGLVAQLQEDFDRAVTLYEECVTLKRELNHPELTRTLGNLAQVTFHMGQADAAVRLFDDCIRIDNDNSDLVHLGVHQTDLALVLAATGDDDRAGNLFRSALRTIGPLGHVRMIACGFEGLATLAVRKREPTRALTLLGAAEALREEIDYPLQNPDQWQYHESVAVARSLVDCTKFDAAWAAGRRLSLDAAIQLALDEV